MGRLSRIRRWRKISRFLFTNEICLYAIHLTHFHCKICAWINAKIHHNLANIHPCLYNMKKKVSAENECQVASCWVRHSYNKLICKVRHDMGVLEHKLTYTEKACRLLYNILGRRLCKGRAYGAMGRFCA